MSKVVIERTTCPRKCGWERPWTNSQEWLDQVIVHPVWGKVTNNESMHKDIFYHNCAQYREAQKRMRELLRNAEAARLRSRRGSPASAG